MCDKPSGSEFRKRAKETIVKNEKLLAKIPKLTTFYKSQSTDVSERNLESSETSTTEQTTDPNTAPENEKGGGGDCSNNSVPATENSATGQLRAVQPQPTQISNDPACWIINEELRDYIAQNGLKQNDDEDFSKSARHYPDHRRHFSKSHFMKKMTNEETVKRSWLVYSPSNGHVYCGPCKLYGGSSLFATSGFNDWRNVGGIAGHENSRDHQQCLVKFITREKKLERIDSQVLKQYDKNVEYWKKVLERVVETLKFTFYTVSTF